MLKQSKCRIYLRKGVFSLSPSSFEKTEVQFKFKFKFNSIEFKFSELKDWEVQFKKFT